jgi:hydroxymethylpyrimidine/phosphomethylpyrimidine kinase
VGVVRPVALTIAGSDPSGGAGIQADLKTFHQFGAYGEAAITLLTVQNTIGVNRVECMPADLVTDQIRAAIADIPPAAAKTGALGNREIIEAVAKLAEEFRFPLVVDPVLVSKHGASLLAAEDVEFLKSRLLPRAFLVTPNLEEAALLAGVDVGNVATMRAAAEKILSFGAQAVLVKGGHLGGDAMDVLLYQDEWTEFTAQRVETRHTHGTGCTYSAAITASLASGDDLRTAIQRAKRYITEAIRTNPGFGSGSGPVNHHADTK